jgi:hypothetical protein
LIGAELTTKVRNSPVAISIANTSPMAL